MEVNQQDSNEVFVITSLGAGEESSAQLLGQPQLLRAARYIEASRRVGVAVGAIVDIEL